MLDQHVYWTDGMNNSIGRFLKGNTLQQEELIKGIPNIGHMIIVRKEELAKKGMQLDRVPAHQPTYPPISPYSPSLRRYPIASTHISAHIST